jgi:peptidoglycan L-alanyl-D-glutamate endopeptidase CwlK
MSRDLNLLHPKVKEQALELQKRARDVHGLSVIFTQTVRTEAEQSALYAQGRQPLAAVNALRKVAALGPISKQENTKIVTKAKTAKDSMHYYGLAFDIAITSPSGKDIIWNSKSDWNSDGANDWSQVGKLADDIGLEWGGNWSSMPDPPHFQNRFGLTLAELKSGKKPA